MLARLAKLSPMPSTNPHKPWLAWLGVRTEFLSARASTMAVRIRIDHDSHRLELQIEDGRFCGLTTAVDVCLAAWFPRSRWVGGSELVNQLAAHIRANYQDKLPRPRLDPRRLPLTLPPLCTKPLLCSARKNKAQREKAQREKATV